MIVTDDLIKQRAYEIWVEEGRLDGFDLAHWERARAELSTPAATPKKTKTASKPAAARTGARRKSAPVERELARV